MDVPSCLLIKIHLMPRVLGHHVISIDEELSQKQELARRYSVFSILISMTTREFLLFDHIIIGLQKFAAIGISRPCI